MKVFDLLNNELLDKEVSRKTIDEVSVGDLCLIDSGHRLIKGWVNRHILYKEETPVILHVTRVVKGGSINSVYVRRLGRDNKGGFWNFIPEELLFIDKGKS